MRRLHAVFGRRRQSRARREDFVYRHRRGDCRMPIVKLQNRAKPRPDKFAKPGNDESQRERGINIPVRVVFGEKHIRHRAAHNANGDGMPAGLQPPDKHNPARFRGHNGQLRRHGIVGENPVGDGGYKIGVAFAPHGRRHRHTPELGGLGDMGDDLIIGFGFPGNGMIRGINNILRPRKLRNHPDDNKPQNRDGARGARVMAWAVMVGHYSLPKTCSRFFLRAVNGILALPPIRHSRLCGNGNNRVEWRR